MYENSRNNEQPELQTLQDIITSPESNNDFYKYRLPPDFFQNVLDCEVNLKEKFEPKIFFDLINYYSKAIEYYESLDDPKFIIYNQALNFLFEQPEAKKFMEGKDLRKEFRKKEIMKRFKQCEKVVTEEKVKLYIEKKTNEETIKKSIDNLYNKDMEKQKNNFKQKLEEKKLKYKDKYKEKEKNQNNNNEIKISNENNKEEDNNKENKSNNIKDEKINKEDDFKFDDNLDFEKMSEEEEISEIDFNLDDVAELVNIAKKESIEKEDDKNQNNSNDKLDEKKDVGKKQKFNSSKNTLNLSKSLKRTNKTRFFEKMQDKFDEYISEYYDYFIKNNIESIVKDFEDNENEVSKNVCQTGVNYLTQIKDMEYLIDSENTYNKEIGNIIKQLEEEKNNKIRNILSEKNKILKTINSKYKINNILLKEKFRLDTTKLLNSFVFK